jgi:hypothetical protein
MTAWFLVRCPPLIESVAAGVAAGRSIAQILRRVSCCSWLISRSLKERLLNGCGDRRLPCLQSTQRPTGPPNRLSRDLASGKLCRCRMRASRPIRIHECCLAPDSGGRRHWCCCARKAPGQAAVLVSKRSYILAHAAAKERRTQLGYFSTSFSSYTVHSNCLCSCCCCG